MIPLRLEIQAFGPYAQYQVIDFKELSAKKLFLIYGETGAGKTVILDAMSYALYGKSSSNARGDFESMRCRYAEDHIDTIISFTFQIDERTYCFKRRIQRKVNRLKEMVSKVSIDAGEIKNGEFYPFFENPKLRNVEEKAIELLHLNHDQFSSVIMLPQGQFEKLLTCGSDEKQEILKTLFSIQNYSAYGEYLSLKARDMRKDMDEKLARYDILMQNMQGEHLENVKQNIDEMKAMLDKQNEDIKSLSKQETKQKEQLNLQMNYHKIQEELQRLYEEEKAYQKEQPRYEKEEALLKQWQKIRNYLPLFEQNEQLKLDQTYHNQEIEKLKQQSLECMKIEEQLKEKASDYEQAKTAFQQMQMDLDQFQRYQKLLTELETFETSIQNIKKQEMTISTSLLEIKKEKALKQQTVTDLEQELSKIAKSLMDKDDISKKQLLYEQGARIHQQINAIEIEIKEISNQQIKYQDVIKQKQSIYQKLFEAHEMMYQRYLDSSAAALAANLNDGEACPVCGSLHHPSLHHLKDQFMEVQTLNRKKQQMDEAYEQWIASMKQDETFQITIVEKQKRKIEDEKRLNELLPQGYDKEVHESLNQQLHFIRETQKQQEQKQQMLALLQKEIGKLDETCHEQEQQLSNIKVEESKHQGQIAMLKKQLPQEIADKQALDKEMSKLQGQIDALRIKILDYEKTSEFNHQEKQKIKALMIKEQEQCELISKRLLENAKKLECVFEDSGIPYDEWQQLSMKKTVMESLEQRLKTYQNNMLQLQTRIKDHEKQLENIVLLNLDELKHQYQETVKELNSLQQQFSTYKAQYELSLSMMKKAQILQRELDEIRPKYTRLNEFARMIRGDNGVGLERYVLGIMLSSITQAANRLLMRVHEGRYQIHRSDSGEGRSRKFGLDFVIYDAYSGSERSVLSLSGGEKFLVSLALSLGLSTVVQSRHGGIHIDAMFVDEGFGSLDHKSIDDALNVLSCMTHGKGMIGIISHVTQLKETISAGIEVMKSSEGSSLRIHT